MHKPLVILAAAIAGIFTVGFAAGQIAGVSLSSAAGRSQIRTNTRPPAFFAQPAPMFGAAVKHAFAAGPVAGGTVTAINDHAFTIRPDRFRPMGGDATATSIVVTSNTTYEARPGESSGESSIKVGSHVIAFGTLSSDGKTLTASHVAIMPAGGARIHIGPHADGAVTAVNGNTISVQADGIENNAPKEYDSVTTIVTTSSTTYDSGPMRSSSSTSPAKGDYVIATGILSSDGKTLTADHITVFNGGLPPMRPGGFDWRPMAPGGPWR